MSDLKPMQLGRVKPLLSSESVDPSISSEDYDWDGGGFAGEASVNDQWKQPCRAATTASITIATALNSGDILDGCTLATGDRVLVKNQGTASQNGIYIVGTTPERAPDMDDDDEVLGAVVYVIAGTANAGTVWTVTNTAATVVGTDAINWAALGGSGTITVEESDGTPTVASVDTVIFDATDFSVTDNSDGSVTVASLGGGVAISSNTPVQDGGAGSAGSGTDASADDHKHPGDAIAIGWQVGDGSAVVTTGGPKYEVVVPCDCTITLWDVSSIDGTSTTSTFDIKRRAFAGGAAASIVGAGTKPTVTAGTEAQAAPSGWTSVALVAGDRLQLFVSTNNNGKQLGVTLTATRN